MTEAELSEAVSLVARFYRKQVVEDRFALQLRLLKLGVQLDHPLPTPDPRAPQGGTPIEIREELG